MAKRKQKDSFAELFDSLADMPWWMSILIGIVVYVSLRFIFPALWPDTKTAPGILAGIGFQLAWLSVVFLVPAILSLVHSRGKRDLLDRQSGIDSIRSLPWRQFEKLLGEAYRRQGYLVFENPGVGPDGGIDLTIKRGSETYLVQCKHWKSYQVGVKVVREMLGLVTAHGATGAIVISSGSFTKRAMEFAAHQPVELIDGGDLVRLIGSVQAGPSISAPIVEPARRVCPRCGRELVLRQAKRGLNVGSRFWGCSGYPDCRHTEADAG